MPKLTQGYQFNSLFDLQYRPPLSVLIGKDYSLTDEATRPCEHRPRRRTRYLGKTITTDLQRRAQV